MKGGDQPPPPLSAWYFTNRDYLPDDQAEGCFYWEYSLADRRGLLHAILHDRKYVATFDSKYQKFRKWSATHPEPTDSKLRAKWKQLYLKNYKGVVGLAALAHNAECKFLARWPEFPKHHWLDFSAPVRSQLIQSRGSWPNGRFPRWDRPRLKRECDEPMYIFFKGNEPESFNLWPYGADDDGWGVKISAVFSWARGDPKLLEDYARWLRDNRPPDKQDYNKTHPEESRKASYREKLKFLGALRLLEHFDKDCSLIAWEAAKAYAESCLKQHGDPADRPDRSGYKAVYQDQSSWTRKAEQARQIIADLRKKFLAPGLKS